jgi:hypothetical protein
VLSRRCIAGVEDSEGTVGSPTVRIKANANTSSGISRLMLPNPSSRHKTNPMTGKISRDIQGISRDRAKRTPIFFGQPRR